MRSMAALPVAARSGSRPSPSTASLSIRASDSLSSTIRRRFIGFNRNHSNTKSAHGDHHRDTESAEKDESITTETPSARRRRIDHHRDTESTEKDESIATETPSARGEPMLKTPPFSVSSVSLW